MRDRFFDDDNFVLPDEVGEELDYNTDSDEMNDLLDYDFMKLEYKRKVQNKKQKENTNERQ